MINTPTGARSAPSSLRAFHLRVSELRRAVPRDLELDKNRQDDLLNLLSLEYPRGLWFYPIRTEFSFLGSKPILHLRPSRPLSSPPHSAINICIYIPLYNEKHTTSPPSSGKTAQFKNGPNEARCCGTLPGSPAANVWRREQATQARW